ncbi:MAG: (Fe-S)-binding protein [Chloroflexi bacterium]|nr:(Fe-S)-binding protein [Chloroflexota bacterium]
MKVRVQLFVTCLVDTFFPEVGEAVVTALTKAGAGVEFPPAQTCCGQPAFNAGFQEEAKRMARYTIELLEELEGPVVIPSGSCAAMLVHGYPELFKDDPDWRPRARMLAARTFEFSQYLVDELKITDFNAAYQSAAVYHPACHLLRGLGVAQQPKQLLDNIDGLQLDALSEECCGFGGGFSIDHAGISAEMLQRRLDQIDKTHADTVIACDVSCLMQLEGGLRKQGSDVRCMHLAQILAGQEAGLR